MQQRLTRKVAAVSFAAAAGTLKHTIHLLCRTQHKLILIAPYM